MDMWGQVGWAAGQIHTALRSKSEPMTVSELKRTSKLNNDVLYLGIGWLLREGNAELKKSGKSRIVSLK